MSILCKSAAELWMERHPYQRRFNDYPGKGVGSSGPKYSTLGTR